MGGLAPMIIPGAVVAVVAIAVLGEKVTAVGGKVDRLEKAMEAKFDKVESKFDSKLDGKFDKLEAKFDAKLDKQEDKLEAKFVKLEAKFDKLEAKLDVLLRRK
ncbi:hypothetical protein HXX76_015866 [Chlamydomonas incerta]|uniref:Uncharacterized protein n=1 Tax=Chlamydomonas incerta TaxID=51695 RepID=A0A835SDG5_CHLIN|nr:hypothetical protein HXX76_015866 [Chlamydomonas incerta]|eukprot:KAG2422702.1 hypothetical protein HXX76_015866 [Chlamydomonas incerta]